MSRPWCRFCQEMPADILDGPYKPCCERCAEKLLPIGICRGCHEEPITVWVDENTSNGYCENCWSVQLDKTADDFDRLDRTSAL